MCIIAVKKKGIELDFSKIEKSLNQCEKENKDGIGIAIQEARKKVFWVKGINQTIALKLVKKHLSSQDAFVLHYRNATSGVLSPGMCHPFLLSYAREVSARAGELKEGEMLLFHNGVIFGYGNKDISDTAEFCQKIKEAAGGLSFKSIPLELWKIFLNLEHSKYALMTRDDILMTQSDQWQEDYGMFFSNAGYQSFSNKWSWGSYGYHKSDFYMDEYEKGWNVRKLAPVAVTKEKKAEIISVNELTGANRLIHIETKCGSETTYYYFTHKDIEDIACDVLKNPMHKKNILRKVNEEDLFAALTSCPKYMSCKSWAQILLTK